MSDDFAQQLDDDDSSSDYEYSESESADESSDNDNYTYPWSTSSDDSWIDMSSDEVIQKILRKLPTYDPPEDEENEDNVSVGVPFQDLKEDSFDEDGKIEEYLEMFQNRQSDEENQDENLFDPETQTLKYDPHLFLASCDLKNIYVDKRVRRRASQMTKKLSKKQVLTVDGIAEELKASSSQTAETEVKTELPPQKTSAQPIESDTKEQIQRKKGKAGDKEMKADVGGGARKEKVHVNRLTLSEADLLKLDKEKKDRRAERSQLEKEKKKLKKQVLQKMKEMEKVDEKSGKSRKKEEKKEDKKVDEDEKRETKTAEKGKGAKEVKKKKEAVLDVLKLGDLIKVTEKCKTERYVGLTGYIRYIGSFPKNDKTSDAVMYGIELIPRKEKKDGKKKTKLGDIDEDREDDDDVVVEDTRLGEHNGSVRGTKYFACEDYRGIFLSGEEFRKKKMKRKKVGKKTRKMHAPKRNNAQLFGNIVANVFQERTKETRRKQEQIQKKLGPREMGKIRYYGGDKEYKDVILQDKSDFLAEMLFRSRVDYASVKKEKKLGPREIGTTHGFKGTRMEDIEEEERQKMLRKAEERRRIEQEAREEGRKLGPREIGTSHGFRGTRMEDLAREEEERERQKVVEKERREKEYLEQLKKEKNLGPRDVEKGGYKGTSTTQLKKEEQEKERTSQMEKEKKEREYLELLKKEKNLGPRDVEKGGYKGTSTTQLKKMEEEKERRKEEEREKKEKEYLEQLKKEKNLGPRNVEKGKYKGTSTTQLKKMEEEQEKKKQKEKEKKEKEYLEKVKKEKNLGPRNVEKSKYKGTKLKDLEREEKEREMKKLEEKKKKEEQIKKDLKKQGPNEYRKSLKSKKKKQEKQ